MLTIPQNRGSFSQRPVVTERRLPATIFSRERIKATTTLLGEVIPVLFSRDIDFWARCMINFFPLFPRSRLFGERRRLMTDRLDAPIGLPREGENKLLQRERVLFLATTCAKRYFRERPPSSPFCLYRRLFTIRRRERAVRFTMTIYPGALANNAAIGNAAS